MDLAIQKAIVRQGFIVWFDETGGKREALGVRYPIGAQTGGKGGQGASSGGNVYLVDELQILTPESDAGKTLKVSEAAKLDINVKIATDRSGRLIYELRMPLKKSDRSIYAVVPSQPGRIGLGVVTVKSPGRSTGGKSGFGGSIAEIGSVTGAVGDSLVDNDIGNIMGNRDPDDIDMGKMTVVRSPSKTSKGIEIWADVSLAARP